RSSTAQRSHWSSSPPAPGSPSAASPAPSSCRLVSVSLLWCSPPCTQSCTTCSRTSAPAVKYAARNTATRTAPQRLSLTGVDLFRPAPLRPRPHLLRRSPPHHRPAPLR